jgi:hypothetical protein
VTSYFHGNAEACENGRPAPRRFYNRNVEELLHKIDAFLCFQSGLEWRTSYNNHPLSKEIALSRKSPKPVPKPSSTSKEHSIIQKRVLYLLDYISRVNRQTLVALHHVGQAPDCQVAKTPSLVQFAHSFKDLEFHVRAFVTESQSTLLQKAASKSLETLLDQAFQMAKGLPGQVASAAQSLVIALGSAAESRQAGDFQVAGCCYFNNSPPVPNVPQSLCQEDPDFMNWIPGPCDPPPPTGG